MNRLIHKHKCKIYVFFDVTHTHTYSITCVIFTFSGFLLQQMTYRYSVFNVSYLQWLHKIYLLPWIFYNWHILLLLLYCIDCVFVCSFIILCSLLFSHTLNKSRKTDSICWQSTELLAIFYMHAHRYLHTKIHFLRIALQRNWSIRCYLTESQVPWPLYAVTEILCYITVFYPMGTCTALKIYVYKKNGSYCISF